MRRSIHTTTEFDLSENRPRFEPGPAMLLGDVEEMLMAEFARAYFDSPFLTVRHLFDAMVVELSRRNERLEESGLYPLWTPSIRTFHRRVMNTLASRVPNIRRCSARI